MNLEISEFKSADVVNPMSADFLSSKYTLEELFSLNVDDKIKIILEHLPDSETKLKLSNLTDKQKEFFNKDLYTEYKCNVIYRDKELPFNILNNIIYSLYYYRLLYDYSRQYTMVIEFEERIIVKYKTVKFNIKRLHYYEKYTTLLVIRKNDNKHFNYHRKKRINANNINFHIPPGYNLYNNVLKDVIEKYVVKEYDFLKGLPSKIFNITECKKYNIKSLEDYRKVKFRFMPKSLFYDILSTYNDNYVVTSVFYCILKNKYSDKETIKKLITEINNSIHLYPKNLIFYDTLRFAFSNNLPFNFKWSERKLNEKHNEYAVIESIKQSKKIKEIKITKFFSKVIKDLNKQEFFNKFNFKVIDKKEDLISLSLTEKHCVLTYLGRINTGECIILTCLFEDKIVTIEITKELNCNQAMFAYNKPCSYIKILLNLYLKEYKKINNIK